MLRYIIVFLGFIFGGYQIYEAAQFEKRGEIAKANNNLLYCLISLFVVLLVLEV